MNEYGSLGAIAQRIGITAQEGGVRNAGRARNYSFALPFDFGGANVAAGGTTNQTQKLTAGGAFVVYAITGTLTNGSGVDVTDRRVTLNIAANDGQWSQNAVSWFNMVGTAAQPFYFLARPVVAPGTNLIITVANNTAGVVVPNLTLHGEIFAVG